MMIARKFVLALALLMPLQGFAAWLAPCGASAGAETPATRNPCHEAGPITGKTGVHGDHSATMREKHASAAPSQAVEPHHPQTPGAEAPCTHDAAASACTCEHQCATGGYASVVPSRAPFQAAPRPDGAPSFPAQLEARTGFPRALLRPPSHLTS